NLLSVTTVLGDTELRAAQARYLLELAGVTGVEVVAGTRDPLDRIVPIRRNNQADILSKEDEQRLRQGRTDAVRFLAEQARNHDRLTLLHVGPITNIGRFAIEFPEDFARLSRIVMMAGHVMPNRDNPEYNAGADPRATQAVFATHVPKIMVGLDVTLRCVMTRDDLDAIRAKDTPLSNAIIGMTELWQKAGHRPGQPPRMPCVHDPLAVLVADDPSLVRLEPMRIRIDDAGRCIRDDGEPNVQVAVDVDPQRVRKRLVQLVG
ncbi:MAG: nucleoside hydrolase, partial [Armatimonadota bacterium]